MAKFDYQYDGAGDFYPGYSTAGLSAAEYAAAPAAVQALYRAVTSGVAEATELPPTEFTLPPTDHVDAEPAPADGTPAAAENGAPIGAPAS